MAENQENGNAMARGNEQKQSSGGEKQPVKNGNYHNRRGRYTPYQGNRQQRDGTAQSADGTQQKPRRNDNFKQGNRGNRQYGQNGFQRKADYKIQEKPLDSAEDIAKDTERLEKEIMLEISEIKAMTDSL